MQVEDDEPDAQDPMMVEVSDRPFESHCSRLVSPGSRSGSPQVPPPALSTLGRGPHPHHRAILMLHRQSPPPNSPSHPTGDVNTQALPEPAAEAAEEPEPMLVNPPTEPSLEVSAMYGHAV